MTTVPSTGNSTSSQNTSSSTTSTKSTTLDYNSFLTLLVAELKNQDPTQPTDPMQYTSQMATFSEVEQSVNMNTKLGSLMTSSALTQAEVAVGRTVTSSDGKTSGVVSAVSIDSSGNMTATLTNGGTLSLVNGVTIS